VHIVETCPGPKGPQRNGPVHGAGINVDKPKPVRDTTGDRALPRSGGAVDGDYNSFLTHRQTGGASKAAITFMYSIIVWELGAIGAATLSRRIALRGISGYCEGLLALVDGLEMLFAVFDG
jgi:hypothetical protein